MEWKGGSRIDLDRCIPFPLAEEPLTLIDLIPVAAGLARPGLAGACAASSEQSWCRSEENANRRNGLWPDPVSMERGSTPLGSILSTRRQGNLVLVL